MKPIIFILLVCSLMIQSPALTAGEPVSGDTHTGPATVAEVINVGSYLYLRLEEADTWIATSPLEVTVGDRVSFSNGAEMRNFYSKTLDRTFESILFVQTVSLVDRDIGKMHKSAMAGQDAEHAAIPTPTAVPAPASGEVQPLDGGKTVADIFANSAALDGHSVSLRAKVIKVSENVVGKNWITLQDGTGSAPEDKLLATSTETASPGDVVIARGIIRKDIEIGSGYRYKVLLEEATFLQ